MLDLKGKINIESDSHYPSSQPLLTRYEERSQVNSAPEVVICRNQLKVYHNIRMALHSLPEKFSSLLLSRKDLASHNTTNSEERKSDIKKAQFAATDDLLRVIGRVKGLLEVCLSLPPGHESSGRSINFGEISARITPEFDSVGSKVLSIYEQSSSIGVSLPLLQDPMKHYYPRMSVAPIEDVLWRWMGGEHPLPQCKYICESEEGNQERYQCEEVSNVGSPFCEFHQCYYGAEEEDKTRCPKAVQPEKALCLEHACQAEGCEAAPLPSQIYCYAHACIKCIDESNNTVVANLASGEPPRNTCEKHPLCCALAEGEPCFNVCLPEGHYCKLHSATFCAFIDDQKNQCGSMTVSNTHKFCKKHQEYEKRVQPMPSATRTSTGACAAKNSKGKPCRGTPVANMKYCRDHLAKYSEEPIRVFEIEQPTFAKPEKETKDTKENSETLSETLTETPTEETNTPTETPHELPTDLPESSEKSAEGMNTLICLSDTPR